MLQLHISPQCVRCGLCIEECPAYIIEMGANGPELTGDTCLACGHCEAICPQEALINDIMDHEDDIVIPQHPVLKPEEAEIFLRSRRSIRCFKPAKVSREETEELLRIGRYAQTGANTQGVSYLVVESTEIMAQLEQLTREFFATSEDPIIRSIAPAALRPTTRGNRIRRGAHMAILGLTPKNQHRRENALYALTYIELYAPTLGLGTCWAGYMQRFMQTDTPEMRQLLNIPEDKVVSACLMYGYPQYRYHKLASRQPAEILWR